MDNRIAAILAPHRRAFQWAGYLLGFALGGFFDGILLHQILQWHHLLSAVEQAPFGDIRIQVMADGLFHAAMYLIAAIGLWSLFRSRYVFSERSADRLLAANLLIGFGLWHMVDGVLSHWLIGIHRIRMDVPNPWFWDILWFVVFGVLFAAAGMLLRRSAAPPSYGNSAPSGKRSTTALLLAASVGAAAVVSALPPAGADPTATVVLRPGASPAQLLAGLQRLDARIVWNSAKGDVWVFALGSDVDRLKFYQHGAMFVSGAALPAGCTAWSRPRAI